MKNLNIDLNAHFTSMENAKFLVIGDVMLDTYWSGKPRRLSPEAPVPVVPLDYVDHRPGGAANVALNIAKFCKQVSLFAPTGDDSAAEQLQKELEANGVNCLFARSASRRTINKIRIVAEQNQIVRVDAEDNLSQYNVFADWQSYFNLLDYDAVVISDYAKGFIGDMQSFIRKCRENSIGVIVDPKGNSFEKYRGCNIITPNLNEFSLVLGAGQSETDILHKGRHFVEQFPETSLCLTRGSDGISFFGSDKFEFHAPTNAKEVYDVTGAGDTLVSLLALCVTTGMSTESSVRVANLAAGLVVGKKGTASVSKEELRAIVLSSYETSGIKQSKIFDVKELSSWVSELKLTGTKIVMTNGCFDILHAGHVKYLEHAKSLGDILIVAVNDDASVSRLKGNNRPINCLKDRLAVLESLSCVDYVTTFSSDAPTELYKQIKPHILVKGSDYEGRTISGADEIVSNGGQVVLSKLVAGRSTTALISKIMQQPTGE
jgi:D-beta-D-heptose 7-phosphate kinase / D-beta-D-heptose 1-phosphate adenosyltransferase